MIVTSVYSIVDGFFVSNFVGKSAFAAVNLIMPFIMALGAFGFMISTGGSALWANDPILDDRVIYGRILLMSNTAFMLQNSFQSFLVTAEKPKFGLTVSIIAGLLNIILDFLLIYVFHWGLAGAAIATAISQVTGAVVPLIYFATQKNSILRLTKAKFDGNILLKSCTNGSSEMPTNISTSFVSMLYNFHTFGSLSYTLDNFPAPLYYS